uniref:UDENN domain-containing protein n=1 Tax=Angiostrongylus cantonensis TaxID=6313 RepID=A0A0K0CSQ2_ANGCA
IYDSSTSTTTTNITAAITRTTVGASISTSPATEAIPTGVYSTLLLSNHKCPSSTIIFFFLEVETLQNLCYTQRSVDWTKDAKDEKKDGDEEKPGVAAVYPWMTRVHSSSGGSRGEKRQRTAYTRNQVLELEKPLLHTLTILSSLSIPPSTMFHSLPPNILHTNCTVLTWMDNERISRLNISLKYSVTSLLMETLFPVVRFWIVGIYPECLKGLRVKVLDSCARTMTLSSSRSCPLCACVL